MNWLKFIRMLEYDLCLYHEFNAFIFMKYRWGSSALYLGSRLSQLVKNRERETADGLSLGMVTCAILANLTYGMAIVMRTSSW